MYIYLYIYTFLNIHTYFLFIHIYIYTYLSIHTHIDFTWKNAKEQIPTSLHTRKKARSTRIAMPMYASGNGGLETEIAFC